MSDLMRMPVSCREAMYEAGRRYCRQVLKLARGNVTRAAQLAGRNRSDFYRLLKQVGYQLPAQFAICALESCQRRFRVKRGVGRPRRYCCPEHAQLADNLEARYRMRRRRHIESTAEAKMGV